MNDNARALMKTFENYKKLNIISLMPELSFSENITLHAIQRINEECEKREEKAKVSMLVCDIEANPTQVSRTLRSLEDKGLIERSVSKKDRRITYVTLSEEGNKYFQKISNVMNDFTEAVFSQMEHEDIKRLIELLNQLYEVAYQEIEKRKPKLD